MENKDKNNEKLAEEIDDNLDIKSAEEIENNLDIKSSEEIDDNPIKSAEEIDDNLIKSSEEIDDNPIKSAEEIEDNLDIKSAEEIEDNLDIKSAEESKKQGSYIYQNDAQIKQKKASGAKIALTVGTIIVLIAGVILSIMFFLNKGVKADVMKLKNYEFQTLKGFVKSDKEALSYSKNTNAEDGKTYILYRYSLNDYTFDDVNAYIESFIEGDNLYSTDKGEYIAYFFENNDVLELFFYQEDDEIAVEWYVYDYVAKDFEWMADLEAQNEDDIG